jgi:hypothetical protein
MIISDCRPGRSISLVDKDEHLIRMPGKTGIKRLIMMINAIMSDALSLRATFGSEAISVCRAEMASSLRFSQ